MELPKPLYQIVVSYAFPHIDDENEISGYMDMLKYFGLDTKVYLTQASEIRAKLAKLEQKYTYYSTDYGYGRINIRGGCCLLDALSTGQLLGYNEYLACTYAKYTPTIEDDIKFLICNFPRSIHCPSGFLSGFLRSYWEVPPLAMACVNIRIPIHIVELLLQNGADPDGTFVTEDDGIAYVQTVKIIDELRCAGVLKVRYEAIKALFLKYRKH